MILNKLKEKLDERIEGDVILPEKSITFLNPYSYLYYRKNINLFQKFDEIAIDGILLVYLLKIISVRVKRKSFDMTSLAPLVFDEAIKKNKTIYFIGAKQKEIEGFIKKINKEYPKLIIAGYRNGYFKNALDRKSAVDNIYKCDADVVVVGMGTPYQEKFIVDLNNYGYKGAAYTCGGFFHQTAQKINYYPKVLDKLNLRWLYRIYDEPKLFKRYFFNYPKFLFLFFWDSIVYKLKKNN